MVYLYWTIFFSFSPPPIIFNFLLQPGPPVMAARNRMLSMQMASCLPVMAWGHYIPHLFVIVNNTKVPFWMPNEICALMASLFHHPGFQPKCLWQQIRTTQAAARFAHGFTFTSPAPQAKKISWCDGHVIQIKRFNMHCIVIIFFVIMFVVWFLIIFNQYLYLLQLFV